MRGIDVAPLEADSAADSVELFSEVSATTAFEGGGLSFAIQLGVIMAPVCSR